MTRLIIESNAMGDDSLTRIVRNLASSESLPSSPKCRRRALEDTT